MKQRCTKPFTIDSNMDTKLVNYMYNFMEYELSRYHPVVGATI